MRIEGFAATSDLIGRRTRVRWTFLPEAGETVADAPVVTLRRKERDFAFPPAAPGDPYLVYDSATFPPAPVPGALIVADLPDREVAEGSHRIREQTITLAEVAPGLQREVLRRTVWTVFAADRTALRQDVEVLDVGGLGVELTPGVTYYYELDSPALAPKAARKAYRVTATPGEAHGLNRTLYQLIPDVHRRHDTIVRAPDAASGLLPEAAATGGQLRRFADVFGSALDGMRSSAEGLWGLHDAADVEPRFLPLLADWIGWELADDENLPQQRNEIRNAPRLYETVGGIPGLRTIVDHYTGWSTRVAEFVQHLTRTNAAPQRNVFGLVDRSGTWWGIDDAAPLLGFASPNHESIGGGGVAAELVGAAAAPFPLRAGMTLTIAVDGALPATITFGAADFADVGAATADEVAAVVGGALRELFADAVGATVRLRSHRVDEGSRLEVMAAGPSLVSLDGAPAGRLATFADGDGRLWLVHATTVGPGALAPSRLQVKPHVRGAWWDARPVEEQPPAPQADPTGTALPSGELWLAWAEHPHTDRAELRWRRGSPQPFTPASVLGDVPGPFALVAGTQLVVTGYGGPETFLVQNADYAAIGAATTAEVVAAVNAQLAGVTATAAANGALALRTAATGPGVQLRVELAASTAARALGLGNRTLVGRGGWDEAVEWSAAAPVTSVAAGRHADCAAVVDPEGAVRLFWSTHRQGLWRIARVRWDDRIIAATAAGVGVRDAGGAWTALTMADGLPSDDLRGLAVDADGSTWYATAAGGAVRTPDGAIAVLSNATTAGGLADDDVRTVAAATDGTVWFGHAAGASARSSGGAWQTFTVADGLASDDVRHLAATGDGSVWFATAAGLSRLDATGRWRTWQVADGLPSDDCRHCALGAEKTLWVATAAGLALLAGDEPPRALSLVDAGGDLGADDVRAVAPELEPVWAATAAGMVELRSLRRAQTHGLPAGLPSNDCRTAFVEPDGKIWAGTPAGAATRAPDGAWQTLTTADGLPDNLVRALHGPWSAPLEFAPAGAGDRDPHVVVDAADRIWLAWSERQAVGDAGDTWLARTRRFAWPGPGWGAPLAVTALPAAGRVTDRDPCVAPTAAGGARVVIRSDRGGGPRLWAVDIDPADVVAAPVQLTRDEPSDSNPAAIGSPDGTSWLLYRSDRSLPLGRLGGGVPGDAGAADASRRAADESSLRRFAGTVTVSLADLDRNRARRRFGDLLSYTPQKPGGTAEGPLAPDELYTRGTIGLYVERGPAGRPLTLQDAQRLRQLLNRFLPVNLRAVIVLRPSALLFEEVFPPGNELEDAYADTYPFVEIYPGLSDAAAAALPDWLLFLATDAASVTADPGDLTTLRRRTWRPPPE